MVGDAAVCKAQRQLEDKFKGKRAADGQQSAPIRAAFACAMAWLPAMPHTHHRLSAVMRKDTLPFRNMSCWRNAQPVTGFRDTPRIAFLQGRPRKGDTSAGARHGWLIASSAKGSHMTHALTHCRPTSATLTPKISRSLRLLDSDADENRLGKLDQKAAIHSFVDSAKYGAMDTRSPIICTPAQRSNTGLGGASRND